MKTNPFPRQLRAWRISQGLTQSGLALRARLPQPYLSKLEIGSVDPSLSTLNRLAGGLSLSIGRLLEGLPPAPGLDRFAADSLARAALGLSGGKGSSPDRVRRLRRVVITRYRLLHGVLAREKRTDHGKTERRLRAELGESQWKALISRIAKLASRGIGT